MFSLSAKKVKEMLENNEALLIDVREEVEYKEEHIEGAFTSLGKIKSLLE
jgi:rhodanese-related sulfurtransferase